MIPPLTLGLPSVLNTTLTTVLVSVTQKSKFNQRDQLTKFNYRLSNRLLSSLSLFLNSKIAFRRHLVYQFTGFYKPLT